jgi:hypothetical protein
MKLFDNSSYQSFMRMSRRPHFLVFARFSWCFCLVLESKWSQNSLSNAPLLPCFTNSRHQDKTTSPAYWLATSPQGYVLSATLLGNAKGDVTTPCIRHWREIAKTSMTPTWMVPAFDSDKDFHNLDERMIHSSRDFG